MHNVSSYLLSSYSHSACGKGDTLNFTTKANAYIDTTDGQKRPFFQMVDTSFENSEERMLSSLDNAVNIAIKNANLTTEELAETAIILGSTSLDISTITPDDTKNIWLTFTDRLSQHLQKKFGLSKQHFTINTACTASINAAILADQLIKHNKANHVIVVGCEFYNPLTLNGFSSLDLITKDTLKTFHTERSGLILGEGIGVIIVGASKPESACIEIKGYGSGCDHHSLTMTQESGDHIVQVIDQALTSANLDASDIDLIKVHGTATLNNDVAEQAAFTQRLPSQAIFALKPFTGHTLGACGVLELAIMDSLFKNITPIPVPNYAQDNKEHLLSAFSQNKTLSDYQTVLLNHCGFGGNNAAIIVKLHQ